MRLKLFHYWRSSCSWRVRWALEIKKVPCERVVVDLLTDATDEPDFLGRNPMGYVPTLELLDAPEGARAARYLTESTAIIEWLEERFPAPALLRGSADERAHVRRLCELINSGVQPLQNLNVLLELSRDPAERLRWAQLWIRKGLKAYDAWIEASSGRFSVGDELSLADLFLIPQCYGAIRQEIDLAGEFPRLASIYENALATPACQASHPDRFKPAG